MIPGSALWSRGMDSSAALKIQFTAVCRGNAESEIVYSLCTSTVGGIFSYNQADNKETRRFHREGLNLSDMDKHPKEDIIACSQRFPNQTACISICRGPDVEPATEGDSVDEAPSWVRDGSKQLVFQSAGIARNREGIAVGLGPCSVQRLNLTTGEMTAVVESNKYDYLQPHLLADGSLLAIRRPYEQLGRTNYPLHKMLLDIILFPFRVLRAFFHFLNFLSLTFSKKPLTTASGQRMEGLDLKNVVLRGRIIDAEKALQESASEGKAPALVPSSWQLIKYRPDGHEEVLASSVASFDVDSQDKVVFSNGSAIFALDGNGTAKQIEAGSLIETLICLD